LTFGAVAAAAASSSSNSDNVTTGALAFLIVAGIGVALVFLLFSMNKQFRKITPPPDAKPPGDGQDAETKAETPK
jgi:hypothetical protein